MLVVTLLMGMLSGTFFRDPALLVKQGTIVYCYLSSTEKLVDRAWAKFVLPSFIE